MPSKDPFIDSLTAGFKKVTASVERQFSGLSVGQLNWQPASGKWSIGQCLDHIMTTNRQYLPRLQKAIEKGRVKRLTPQRPFRSNWFGRWFARSVGPEAKRKMKTQRIFTPSGQAVGSQLISAFSKHQQELIQLIESAAEFDLIRLKVSSPVNALIRFRLGDACKVLLEHEKRHLQQAERVRSHENFPEN